MIELKGIKYNIESLQNIEEIGALLFQEFNSTKIYVTKDNEIYIREWVDCNPENLVDRYFYFKTNKTFINKFLNLELSHRQLIENSLDSIYFFQDFGQECKSDYLILTFDQIPEEYLPGFSSNITLDDFVDSQEIMDYLNLNDLDTFINLQDEVKEFSKYNNTDIYNLHLEKGLGVGHGKIDTNLLGKSLIKFDDLYENIVLDVYLGKARGKVSEKLMLGKHYQPLTKSEVLTYMAASFSVLIKPTFIEYSLFENVTSSDAIADRIFFLINSSIDTDLFKDNYSNFSEYTLSSYKNFLKEFTGSNVNFGIYYISASSDKEYLQRFNQNLASKVINDIESLKLIEEETFSKIGNFRALNCETGHFWFNSLDGEIFKGYLDKLIRESSISISFQKKYEISISRKTIKEVEKEDPEIQDTIIAYYNKD